MLDMIMTMVIIFIIVSIVIGKFSKTTELFFVSKYLPALKKNLPFL